MGTSSWVCYKLACIISPTKKLLDFYNNQRAFGYSSASTNFATVHSRKTVGGCSVEYKYTFLRQFARVVAHRMLFYLFEWHCCRATWRVFWTITKKFQFALFVHKVTRRLFFQYPVAFNHCHSVLFWDVSQKRFMWPCSELLWLCSSNKSYLVPPIVVVNWCRSSTFTMKSTNHARRPLCPRECCLQY